MSAESKQLTISKIYGTSSETSSQFITQGNLIAYSASGGVVVCKVNKSLEVQWQKFFCANSLLSNETKPYTYPCAPINTSSKLDEFEFPLHSDPEYITKEGNTITDESKDVSDSPTARSIKFRKIDEINSNGLSNRVRSINCIAISPDRKMLAVGEVGYQPRVLIYSLAYNSSCKPIYIIQEHQFGINSLCFSTDSKKLCSLGLVNDGFLIVWRFQNKKVTFSRSNKCSSIVNKLIWHDDNVITIGLRHIKIWKDDTSRTNCSILKGRNVLLKNFLSSSFVDIDCINFNELLVLTDQGDVGLISLLEETINLKKVYQLAPSVNQILIDHNNENLIAAGKSLELIPIDKVLSTVIEGAIRPSPSSPTKIVKKSGILALQEVYDCTKLVYLNNAEIMSVDCLLKEEPSTLVNAFMRDLMGFKSCFNGDVLVWSKAGMIKKLCDQDIKLLHSIALPSNELIENSLVAVDADDDDNLVAGDKYGHLYFMKKRKDFISGYQEVKKIRAHESSINDLIIFKVENVKFIASCSRDRTIQIFKHNTVVKDTEEDTGIEEWELFQTLSSNKGNILKVLSVDNKLISSSSDRTVSIYRFEITDNEPLIYQDKLIAIKNTSLTFGLNGNKELVVSTNDKNLLVYDLQTYELARTLKLLNKNFESLQIDNFQIDGDLIYTSCSDKCVRLFNYNDGKLISSNWGHSETIIGLILVNNNTNLVTASHDGCMFNWILKDLSKPATVDSSALSTGMPEDDFLSSPPKVMRKILHTGPALTPLKQTSTNRLAKSPSPNLRLSSKSSRADLSPSSISPTSSSRLSSRPDTTQSARSPTPGLSRSAVSGITRTQSLASRASTISSSARQSSSLNKSPTFNVTKRLSGLRLDDKPTIDSLESMISSAIEQLKQIQKKLIDEQQICEDGKTFTVFKDEMNKTMRLLPGYDRELLDSYSNALLKKLTIALASEKDKENIENV